jgi:organic hydroperoxide reductase OsmC/OhrA
MLTAGLVFFNSSSHRLEVHPKTRQQALNKVNMAKEHHYRATITWTGNKGLGTSDYRSYGRDHTITLENKAPIFASADPSFRGDAAKHNPEELLLAALSGCHLLWYLHLCADQGITVVDYQDQASGTMAENPGQGGHFTEVTLRPAVTISNAAQVDQALALHREANKSCFIANSCNFPVHHQPTCRVAATR